MIKRALLIIIFLLSFSAFLLCCNIEHNVIITQAKKEVNTIKKMSTIENDCEYDFNEYITTNKRIERYNLVDLNGNIQHYLYENDDCYVITSIDGEILEYSNIGPSIFFNYHNYIMLYGGINQYYIYNDNSIIDLISNKSFAYNFNNRSTTEIFVGEDLDPFNNRIILEESEIENAYFFKNMRFENEINTNNGCGELALAMLLAYYDTFYNGNIIKNYFYYSFNNVSKTIQSLNKTAFNSLNYENWNNSTITYLDGDTLKLLNEGSPVEPSNDFYDFFINLAIENNYTMSLLGMTTGLFDMSMINLAKDYINFRLTLDNANIGITANDVSGNSLLFGNQSQLDPTIVESLIDQGIPVILGISNYTLYEVALDQLYYQYPSSGRGKSNTGGYHYVVAYGYEHTTEGDFFKVHSGWCNNQYFVEQESVKMYLTIDYDDNHVCSDNYKLKENDISISYKYICPCTDWHDYFDWDNYDSTNHAVPFYNDSTFLVQFVHYGSGTITNDNHCFIECDDNSYSQHYVKCDLFDECNGYRSDNHVFIPIYNTSSHNHYHACIICGFITGVLSDRNYSVNDGLTHHISCSYCSKLAGDESHTLSCLGVLNNHYRYCIYCNYIISETHIQSTPYGFDARRHQYDCSCGNHFLEEHNYNNNLICTICGYEHLHHTFANYEYLNGRQHIGICLCGETITENHFFITSGIGLRCKKCGYFTTDPVIINNYNQNN